VASDRTASLRGCCATHSSVGALGTIWTMRREASFHQELRHSLTPRPRHVRGFSGRVKKRALSLVSRDKVNGQGHNRPRPFAFKSAVISTTQLAHTPDR
jgi:hypothetical protein